MIDYEKYSTEELMKLQDNGRRKLLALEMGNLADVRVSAHYEPFPYDSGAVLDSNLRQISRVRQALRDVAAEIAARADRGRDTNQLEAK